MNFVDWLILVGRVVAVFLLLLISVMIVIWYERKLVADMQTRIGPNRAGPAGILISIADGIKLFFKEGITPTQADRPVYVMAPVIQLVPAFLAFAVIPFGTGVTIVRPGRPVPDRRPERRGAVDPRDVSLAVYGIVLAGWSSGSNYPLLGSIRSSAQMISYEVGMSLGLVAVLMYSGTLSMSEIVEFQARHFEATWVHPSVDGPVEHHRPVPGVRDLHGRRPGRDQPAPVRPARGRERAGRRLQHRVLRHQVRDVLPGRVPAHDHRLGRGGDAVPGRLARAEVRRRAVAVADRVVPGEALRAPVPVHVDPGDAAAVPLRPADAPGVEGDDPGGPVLGHGHRRDRRPPGRLRSARSSAWGCGSSAGCCCIFMVAPVFTPKAGTGRPRRQRPGGSDDRRARQGHVDDVQADLPAQRHHAVPEGDPRPPGRGATSAGTC